MSSQQSSALQRKDKIRGSRSRERPGCSNPPPPLTANLDGLHPAAEELKTVSSGLVRNKSTAVVMQINQMVLQVLPGPTAETHPQGNSCSKH